MVTARKAFEGSSAASVISAVMSGTPKALASLQPLTPPALEDIVTACLAKDPEERWQSAADVARQLRGIAARPEGATPKALATGRRGIASTLEGRETKIFNPKSPSDAISYPRLQPDGKTVLATGRFSGDSRILSLPAGTPETIWTPGSDPYLTPSGHIVAAGKGVLLAAPFDAKSNRAGDPITLLEDLRTTSLSGAQYALSDTGTLLYASGGATDEGRLVRVDRSGNAEDLGVPPGIFQHVAMARNGNLVAASMQERGKMHVFVFDLRRPLMLTRLTSDGTINAGPVWDPQGDKIVFHSDRGGASRLWIQAADGNSAAVPIQEVGPGCLPTCWTRDGRQIIFEGFGPKSNKVLKVLDMSGKPQSRILLDSGGDTFWGLLSPDARRILYVSYKSGVAQIYIRPWPDTSSREIQISTQTGSDSFGLSATTQQISPVCQTSQR